MKNLKLLKSSVFKTMRDDRGFVLILALVAMLAMTVIGVSLIMNMTTEMQIARNEREAKTAFNLAEAAINEGIARLRVSSADPNYVGEPNASAVCGGNFPCPRNPAGWGGTYGTTIACADGLNCTLSVVYLVEQNSHMFCDGGANNGAAPNTVGGIPGTPDCSNGEVVMYGQDFNISKMLTSNQIGKFPVYQITGTGTVRDTEGNVTTERQVVAFVGGSSMNTDTGAALNTNNCFNPSGMGAPTISAEAGFSTTIIGVTNCGYAGPETLKPASAAFDPNTYLTGSGQLSDLRSIADEVHYCTGATCNNKPPTVGATPPYDDIPTSGDLGQFATPINLGDYAGDTYSTIIYLVCTGRPCSFTGVTTGRGILVIEGDVEFQGNFSYEGLIYVTGTLKVAGGGGVQMNVTGGIMSNGMTTSAGSNVNLDYSPSTLMDVGRSSSSRAVVGWKRL